MRAGIFIGRRNAHQSLDLQFQLIPAKGHESNCLTRIDARLLRLKPGIDLNIKPKAAALLAAFLGKRAGDLFAVDALDDIKQRHGIRRLVGLQRADQTQLYGVSLRFQRRPLALRFLHTVFAEYALAGIDDRLDHLRIKGLRDRDEGNIRRLAAGFFRDITNALPDILKTCFDFHHKTFI
ncbi:hypothetical protein D3C86_1049120 [compost metagenome]